MSKHSTSSCGDIPCRFLKSPSRSMTRHPVAQPSGELCWRRCSLLHGLSLPSLPDRITDYCQSTHCYDLTQGNSLIGKRRHRLHGCNCAPTCAQPDPYPWQAPVPLMAASRFAGRRTSGSRLWSAHFTVSATPSGSPRQTTIRPNNIPVPRGDANHRDLRMAARQG